MIKIKNLKKSYNNKIILNDISLEIKNGDFFSLLGKNGAGKTTTIGILTSLIKKDKGEIIIENYNIDKNSTEIKKMIGFMPQEYNFNQFETVNDIIINQAGFYGIRKDEAKKNSEHLLNLFDLWNLRYSSAMTLSGGFKRRLMLVRALIHKPKIIILDEPTSGVDIASRYLIWNFLKDLNKKEKKTIILTSHYLEEIKYLSDSVVIIDKGKIIINTTVDNLINSIKTKTFNIETEYNNEKKTINITLNKEEDLNTILTNLINKNIKIKNITNTNNLEESFINLTK